MHVVARSDQISFEWSELAPGGVLIYYADGDEEILHVNQYVLDLFECDTTDEFMELTGGTFRGFVYEQDVTFTEDSIWGQVASRNGLDHIYYRIKTKTGAIVSIDDYGRLVQREDARPLFYVFVVKIDRNYAIDWLTGLPDVDRFFYVANIEAEAMIQRGDTPALLVFDLMGMKSYNALNGRDEGDKLLNSFANLLRQTFGGELCCRAAGDSFYTLCESSVVDEGVQKVFEAFSAFGADRSLPVMAGACEMGTDEELSIVLDRAKFACDADRTTWESHLTWYTDVMREDSLIQNYVLEHVDEAIEKGWIRPYYQGLVRTASGAVCGQEALARWIDPVHGFLSPAQFIPTLEEAGLLRKLDLHIIDCVLSDMQKKREIDHPLLPVSVNVSLRDLGHVNLAEHLIRRTDEAQIPHDLLCVEFTESTASTDPVALRLQIEKLRAAGFPVWMDDFGSGYSSLNSLGSFEFDLIKLDMGFLYEKQLEKSCIIIDSVVRAAKRMGLKTLAEGVENQDQANILGEIGCDVLQGYHYFKPEPLEDIFTKHAQEQKMRLEPYDERGYWDAISSVSLTDLAANGEGKGVSEVPVAELPAGVCELRDDQWWVLRANQPMCEALGQIRMLPHAHKRFAPYDAPLNTLDNESFTSAIDRCRRSGTWERISSIHREMRGFQFYVSPLATCNRAEAYLVVSTPNLLGAALGAYGDVPVGYAVLRVIPNEAGNYATDAEYVYANDHYRHYGEFGTVDLAGKTIAQNSSIGGEWLLPYCYRAAMLGEHIHDVVYNERSGHWLSFNVSPSPVPNCCIFAFTLADAEQRTHEKMTVGMATSELIISTANALNAERDYDEAMNDLLDAMSKVIHPDRLYIYERGTETMSNTFEWCAPGVEPQIQTLQNMPNNEFVMWNELLARESVIIISDTASLAGTDARMYEHLTRQGIDRMLAVPLYAGGNLIGFLGADNYRLEERLDTHRLLSTIASFVGARITHQRLVMQLQRLRTHDSLTGTLNRHGIDETIAARIQEQPDAPFALALVRVDNFRDLNMLYGLGVGDAALRLVFQLLEETFPASAIIGRNGGDEALVALFEDDMRDLGSLGGRLQKLTRSPLELEHVSGRYTLTLSAGYALSHGGGNLKETYTHADEALRAVTHAGGGGYRIWDSSLRQDQPQRVYYHARKGD